MMLLKEYGAVVYRRDSQRNQTSFVDDLLKSVSDARWESARRRAFLVMLP